MAGELTIIPDVTDIATVVETTKTTVEQRFAQVTEYADDAMNAAMEQLAKLEVAAEDYDFVVPTIGAFFPAPIAVGFNPGDSPTRPADVEIYLPEFPDAPILAAVAFITDIADHLQTLLDNGGTGMNPDVEEQIFHREEERAILARDEARANLTSEWAKRGFDLPDGVLVATLTQEEIDYRNKRLDVSRDIMIKQYELAFQETQFIIQQVLVMEKLVIDAVSENNKSLIQKYAADIEGIKGKIQAAVERVKGIVELYKGDAAVYEAKAKAQAAIAEVDVKAAEAQINVAIANMQLFVKQAELHMHNAEAVARIRVAAAEGGGRIAASLAAGALSGVSVQAHLSASGNAAKNYNASESASEGHSYDHSTAKSW